MQRWIVKQSAIIYIWNIGASRFGPKFSILAAILVRNSAMVLSE